MSFTTFRYSLETHWREYADDIGTVQEGGGHEDVKTTMIHTHVLNCGSADVRSPLDGTETISTQSIRLTCSIPGVRIERPGTASVTSSAART
jgi:hypothetical protein